MEACRNDTKPAALLFFGGYIPEYFKMTFTTDREFEMMLLYLCE
jgi:hypothetical protein